LALDAIIIAESGKDVTEGIIPERLKLDGRSSSVQVVQNYLEHHGQVIPPVAGDGLVSWWSAPKLNGIHLFNYLTKQNFDVELINKYFVERDVFRDLLYQEPRAVVISSTFIRRKQALRDLTDDIRSLAPDIFIIVGGSFVYLSYLMLQRGHDKDYVTPQAKDDFLFFGNNEPSVDLYIVSLLGEQTLYHALKRIKQSRSVNDLPNSARLKGNEYIFSKRIDDISSARDTSIDWRSLPDSIFSSGVLPLQSSRGCPYKCAFCNFARDHRLMFKKPISQLVDELKALSSRGIRYIWFVDDNFRLGSSDLNTVCQRFVAEGIEIKWMTMVRADTMKDVDAELLRRSGCIEVQLGLESAHQQILRNMNKKADPNVYSQVVEKLLGAGINCSCYFIFGFPGETDETALHTRGFIASIEHPELKGTLSWTLIPFSLVPMSPIYEIEMRKKYELIGYRRDWKHRTMDSDRAKEHIKEAFSELENSCAIYRGDNLDALLALPPYNRKKFFICRQNLSKAALKGPIKRDQIVRSFTEALF